MKDITKRDIVKELTDDLSKSTLLVKLCIVILLVTVIFLVVIKGSIGISIMLSVVAIIFTVLDIKSSTERGKKIKRIENGDFTIKSVECIGKRQDYDSDNYENFDIYLLNFGKEHGEIDVGREVYNNTEVGDMFYIVYFDEDETDIHLMYNQKEYRYCE